MGVYELIEGERHNNHSVYKLKHTTEVDEYLPRQLYMDGIFWKVRYGDFSATATGSLQSLAEPDNPMPPRTGWTYYSGSNTGQQPDPELKAEPLVKDPWCLTITVTAIGRASLKIHTLLGPYKRTEFWSSGKPVYQQAGGAHYLLHYPNKLGWSIRSTMGTSEHKTVYTGSGTICPAD